MIKKHLKVKTEDNLMDEEYKTIEGYSGYQISNFGNVINIYSGEWLQFGMNNGYCQVSLKANNTKNFKTLLVHRLVALAFIDNPLKRDLVDHINGIRSDNMITNLRWASTQENNANQKKRKTNTTGYKGIQYDKDFEQWTVNFPYNAFGSRYYKAFDNVDDAIIDRVEQMKKRYGNYVNQDELLIYEGALSRRNNHKSNLP